MVENTSLGLPRDGLVELETENQVISRKMNEYYNDCRRLTRIIIDNCTEEQMEKILKDIEEQGELLEKWNLLDDDD